MSVLPSGQPLHRALPDLEDLMADPGSYLRAAPLAFGPRRMYGLAGLFALPGVAFLVSCVVGQPDGERVAMGVGLLVGALVWLTWSVMMRGHEIVLHADGVEVVYNDASVQAPWALFHVEGRPFVPDSDGPRAGLTLPINPAAIPYVEMRRGDMVIAYGLQVRGPQWAFNGRDEVVLPARYEITASDVGELLLFLGGRLGRELPAAPPPPEAELPPLEPPAAPDPAGWFTVPLTRLRLPPCCARCEGPRDDSLPLPVVPRGDWLTGPLLGGLRQYQVLVPVCEPCRDAILRRQRANTALGLVVGGVLGATAGALLGGWLTEGTRAGLALGALLGLLVGSWVGSVVAISRSRAMPVQVRRFSPSRGVLQVRCDNPNIAAMVREAALPPRDPQPRL
jgi:hypothetical protein